MATTVEGVIRAVNSHGLRLDGEQDWRNYSKFARPEDLGQPASGQRVVAELDKAGFVRKLTEVLPPIAGGSESRAAYGESPAAGAVVDKDTLIIRQSSIKAAVDFLTHNEHSYSLDQLFSVAASIEAWVTRQ